MIYQYLSLNFYRGRSGDRIPIVKNTSVGCMCGSLWHLTIESTGSHLENVLKALPSSCDKCNRKNIVDPAWVSEATTLWKLTHDVVGISEYLSMRLGAQVQSSIVESDASRVYVFSAPSFPLHQVKLD